MFILVGAMFMMYFGLKSFFLVKKHLLMMLLSLEFICLIMILIMVNVLNLYNMDIYLIIYFIVVLVCEAVLGLVLLTVVVRCYGSDYVKSLFIIFC